MDLWTEIERERESGNFAVVFTDLREFRFCGIEKRILIAITRSLTR